MSFDEHNSYSGLSADYIALRRRQGWPQQSGVSHAASFNLSRLIPKHTERRPLPSEPIPEPPKQKMKKTGKKYFYTCFCGKPVSHQKMCRGCQMQYNWEHKVPGWTCPICGGPKNESGKQCADCRYGRHKNDH